MATMTVRNIPEDAKTRFRTIAAAHGRSMEEHLRAMIIDVDSTIPTKSSVNEVSRPYHAQSRDNGGNWVAELIELANGADLRIPEWRGNERIAPDYPAGMEPLPGESFVDHITRISRPGFDLEIERDRTPHREPRV